MVVSDREDVITVEWSAKIPLKKEVTRHQRCDDEGRAVLKVVDAGCGGYADLDVFPSFYEEQCPNIQSLPASLPVRESVKMGRSELQNKQTDLGIVARKELLDVSTSRPSTSSDVLQTLSSRLNVNRSPCIKKQKSKCTEEPISLSVFPANEVRQTPTRKRKQGDGTYSGKIRFQI